MFLKILWGSVYIYPLMLACSWSSVPLWEESREYIVPLVFGHIEMLHHFRIIILQRRQKGKTSFVMLFE